MEYAGNRIERVEQRAGKESASAAYRGVKKLAVKTAPRMVASPVSSQKVKTQAILQKKACADIHEGGKGSKTGCHGLFSQAARQSAKTAKTTARGLKAIAEAATHAVKAVFAALMAGGGAVFTILILIVGIIGGAVFWEIPRAVRL